MPRASEKKPGVPSFFVVVVVSNFILILFAFRKIATQIRRSQNATLKFKYVEAHAYRIRNEMRVKKVHSAVLPEHIAIESVENMHRKCCVTKCHIDRMHINLNNEQMEKNRQN